MPMDKGYSSKGGLKVKGSNKMKNTIGTKDTGRLSAKKGKKIYLGKDNRGDSNLMGISHGSKSMKY